MAYRKADIRAFFDEATNTVSYLVADPATHEAAIVDPVLDYDPKSGQIATASADALLSAAREAGVKIVWILETHAHADHLSAAQYLKAKTGAKTGIGADIGKVQKIFGPVFNETPDRGSAHGKEFDRLFTDGETFGLGALTFEVLATPGHTAACISYKVGDAVFVGDTLFMPDYGTARADFRVATRASFTVRSAGCSPCRPRRGSSCATTTRRRAAILMRGKQRLPRSAPAMSTSMTASTKRASSTCGGSATPRSQRPFCCCRRSR